MTIPDNSYFPFMSGEETMRKLAEGIREKMYNYVEKSKLQSLVLGISGGIDSTLCAALLRPVCENLNIPLIGRSITKLRQGNMKARMRMMALYDLAQLYHGMVISTDNYTEYLTGFWTLHGDVGDYAPVQHLWKTEIYNLATYLLGEETPQQQAAMQSCIDATPVDGLGISSCDCEQLGVENYFEADRIFAAYFQGDESLRDHTLIKRYYAAEYKRHNPACLSREDLVIGC